MIRTQDEVMAEIEAKEHLKHMYGRWTEAQQQEFLDFCTGVRGVKTMYDFISKEVLSPEYTPERVDELLSLLLGQKVRIVEVLPNDSTRIANESSLVIMDIVVQLEDGSIANLEIQKIGYKFPGERSACYSADLLLRQYKRVRSRWKDDFSYKNIKHVYTIVLFEHSPSEFRKFPGSYLHYFEQMSNTGLKIELLQKYLFIPLDIFQIIKQTKENGLQINNRLDAWLAFLCSDEPDTIITIIEKYPDFKAIYEQIYSICRNIEGVMNMFSEELRILDRNTVQLMIDEMQEELNLTKQELEAANQELETANQELVSANQGLAFAEQKLLSTEQELVSANQKLEAEQHNNIINLITVCQEFHASFETAMQKIMQNYSLSEAKAKEYMDAYWQQSQLDDK